MITELSDGYTMPAGNEAFGDGARHSQVVSASMETLLDAAPDAMVFIEQRGGIRLVNRQAEVLFGYPREELVGQPLEVLVPERVRGVHPDHRAGYFAHPTSRPMGAGLELAACRKDGSEFPVDISLSSLETEDGVLVSAAVRVIYFGWTGRSKYRFDADFSPQICGQRSSRGKDHVRDGRSGGGQQSSGHVHQL